MKNAAYKSVNKELRELKREGFSNESLGDNWFSTWQQGEGQLPEDLQKEYLSRALRSWEVTDIQEEDGMYKVYVTLQSADMSFLESDQLKADYLPWLVSQTEQIQTENIGITNEELTSALYDQFYDALRKQIESAPDMEFNLVFDCDPGDAHIVSVQEVSES